MQLISLTLFTLALISFLGALRFVTLWHRANRQSHTPPLIREGINHIGISAIVEYPRTTAPLIALLEEEYPFSEAIVITDLKRHGATLGEMISQFCLIKVFHSHIPGIRALYRSRHRAYRRVVVIDLPTEQRCRAIKAGKAVAAYDYVLCLEGESHIARNTLAYCANLIASHPITKVVTLESIIGAKARLEKVDRPQREQTIHLSASRILAWRRAKPLLTIFAVSLPAIIVALAHILGDRVLILTAVIALLTLSTLLYLSCRVVTEKGLFATTCTIIENFYRFIVERVKNFHYLYKGCEANETSIVNEATTIDQPENNRDRV
jgi:hypothetical protein